MLKYILVFITLLSVSLSMVETETQAQEIDLSYELLLQVGTGQAMHLDWGDRAPGISVRTTHSLQVVDPETLEVLWNKDSPTAIGQVAWHDNGQYVASTSEEHLEIFNYETNEETIIENQALLWTLAWHPVDLKIAGSTSNFVLDEEKVLIWDVTTGEQTIISYDFANRVDTLAWSPDGDRLAIGSRSGKVVIYDVEADESIELWQVPDGAVQSLAWHPEGLMLAVASSHDSPLTLWDTETLEQINSIDIPDLSSQISWDTSGEYLAGQSIEGITIWNIKSNALAILEHESQPVLDFAWHDLSLALLFQDGKIEVWDTLKPEIQISESNYTGLVSRFDVNTEHNLIAVMFRGFTIIQVLDANSGELRQSIQPHSRVAPSDLLSVSWNESGDKLAIAFHEMIEIWEFDTSSGMLSYMDTIIYIGRISDIEWHPILTDVLSIGWGGFEQRTLLLVDTTTNTIQNEILLNGLIELSWHPDGKQVAVRQNIQPNIDDDPILTTTFMQILDADKFQAPQTLILEEMAPLAQFHWIPGTTDLFGIQCRISVEGCAYWMWNSLTQSMETVNHDSAARSNAIAISPDGLYIAIGDAETGVHILSQSLAVELIILDFMQQPEVIRWEENTLYVSDGILSVYVIE